MVIYLNQVPNNKIPKKQVKPTPAPKPTQTDISTPSSTTTTASPTTKTKANDVSPKIKVATEGNSKCKLF